MLPAIIENILSLRENTGAPVAAQNMNQIIIPNFPALDTINYNIAPTPLIHKQIYYEMSFGQAMVPHSFDVKMYQAGEKVFDAIISGRFTTRSADLFFVADPQHPLQVYVTNLRSLVNYYEATLLYLDIKPGENWDTVDNYLRRYHLTGTSSSIPAGGVKS